MRIALCVAIAIGCVAHAHAYTPESPEVRKMIDAGLKHLESVEETRLGGVCLIALAFIKDDKPDHPWVGKALQACRQARQAGKAEDMYSNGLAVIFLCELDASKHRSLIDFFIAALQRRQKDHGGWGYDHLGTGDTSQSQYGALALWEAHMHGVNVNPAMAEKAAKWLMATQDPSGAWGYQGKLAKDGKLVEQDEITCSMVAAGLGSILICVDLFELVKPGQGLEDDSNGTPEGASLVADTYDNRAPPLRATNLNSQQVLTTVARGDAWMEKNYKVEIKKYTSYYMYALERYRSFQEHLTGIRVDEPDWYNNGVEYAMQSQQEPGKWDTGCGNGPDTAFTVLFLLRSTQKSIGQSYGEGLSIGAIGVPLDLRNMTIRDGQLVANQPKTEIGEMMDLIDDEMMDKWDAMLADPDALDFDANDEKDIRQLTQLARTGPWQARTVAVRTLARTGNLDHAPTLLYAMTDPQRDVVLAARDGLRFLSRRFDGFGLADNFDETQRYDALNKWKNWYRSIRPDVPVVIE